MPSATPKKTSAQKQAAALNAAAGSAATAFLVAVCCVFPLYIDRFSNLGVTKFTGGFALFVLFTVALGACALVGATPPAGRWAGARRDATVWSLAAFVAVNVLATALSLSPLSSLWGLGGYYGGLMMVLYTAAGYLCVRSFALPRQADMLFFAVGVTSAIVAVLYLLNIFNIDLIGAYADTAVVERAQFFSTLGQKNFNGGFFAIALPIVFYAFFTARTPRLGVLYGVNAAFGALALAIVDAEGLTLGILAAVAVLVCHRGFDTGILRRFALTAAAFFGWAGWMHHMRATTYTQGGTPLLARLGAPAIALPGAALSLLLWAALAWRAARGRPERPLYRAGRALTAAVLAGAAGLFLAANFLPGFPTDALPAAAANLLVFNGDWGTYRGTAWQAVAGAWADAPLWRKVIGYGPGTMHTAVMDWAGAAATDRLKTFYAAHNEYLEQLLTTGLLGLAAWGTFVVAHLRRGLRGWGRPGVAAVLLSLCSYLAQAAVSIRVSMNFPLVMLLFALLAALCAPQEEPDPPARPGIQRARIVGAAILAMPAAHLLAQILFRALL